MDILNMVIGFLSSNLIGVGIVAGLAVIYYGLLPILNMYRCHNTVIKMQRLGGVKPWTFKKCVAVKLKSMTWDKVFKPSKYKRKVTIAEQYRTIKQMTINWFTEWFNAILAYSPRTHMKTLIALRDDLQSYKIQMYDYRGKYTRLVDDCGMVIKYLDEEHKDEKITFDAILIKAQDKEKEKEKLEKKDNSSLSSSTKDHVSSFA